MLDQARKLLDLDGERLRGRQRLIEDGLDLGLHGAQPAAELGELTGEIAGAAGEVAHLVGDFRAVAGAGGNGIVDGERGKDAERRHRRFDAGEAEAEIEQGAERAGDEHHADRDEDGADAHHGAPHKPHDDQRAAKEPRTSRP